MTDLYPILDVTVTMDLKLSENNFFDILTHLIGSHFSQNKFSSATSSILTS